MPDKLIQMSRARPGPAPGRRPRMLAISGDSASGKTTLSKGLVEALGSENSTIVGVDDYHRYDREERKDKPFTPLHPDCNYIGIMEQHLQLLATGQEILKPVYDHSNGKLVRPELVEPKENVIVEGLLPLHTKLMRACFDVTVYLDPPEEIRYKWKIERDTTERGYTEEEVRASLDEREPESEQFIRPQRSHADIVVRFGPIEERDDPEETPLSATLLLRPTIPHPNLTEVLSDDQRSTIHLKLARDEGGRPVDALHVHGYAPPEESQVVEKLIWEGLGRDDPLPDSLGMLTSGERSAPLAITQLILLHHLLRAAD
ncbi:MAG TPA: phosphoribulokinase [Nitriliruptorales bacterium]|nr:phosphoribulokinase [Nitriliruptorales bacterium]